MLLPFVLIYMLRLVNDEKLMGVHRNGPWFNGIAWATTMVMIGLTAWLVATGVRDLLADDATGYDRAPSLLRLRLLPPRRRGPAGAPPPPRDVASGGRRDSSRARRPSRPRRGSCGRRPASRASSHRAWACPARLPGSSATRSTRRARRGSTSTSPSWQTSRRATSRSCDEWSDARWVRDAAGLDCPENVRQLVRLALAAPGA